MKTEYDKYKYVYCETIYVCGCARNVWFTYKFTFFYSKQNKNLKESLIKKLKFFKLCFYLLWFWVRLTVSSVFSPWSWGSGAPSLCRVFTVDLGELLLVSHFSAYPLLILLEEPNVDAVATENTQKNNRGWQCILMKTQPTHKIYNHSSAWYDSQPSVHRKMSRWNEVDIKKLQ